MEINMGAPGCQYQFGVKRMSTPWDQFIDAIEKRKSQLDELLAAYANFRQKLDALPPEVSQEAQRILATAEAAKLHEESTKKNDLIGKSALDCAKIILTELNNEPIHFSTIAKMAMARGYKGRAEGSPEVVESRIQNSFWAALHRSEDFESVGKGCYRLSAPNEDLFGNKPLRDISEPSEPEEMTQKQVAKRTLEELGRSASYTEIMHEAMKRGWLKIISNERNLANSLYGMLTRSDDVFVKVGPGEFDLVEREK
jgi:hypothetical protein